MGREIREGERGHKRGKKKSSAFRFIRRLFLGSVLFLFVLSVLGYVIFIRPEVNRLRGIAYDKLAGSNLKDLTKRADTVVFDTDGQQLGTINAGHFVYDKIEDISPNLQNAYIAQEDRNFKTHHGVDYKATLRAVFQLVKNRGRITQGGSIITQQVVKNT